MKMAIKCCESGMDSSECLKSAGATTVSTDLFRKPNEQLETSDLYLGCMTPTLPRLSH